MAGCREGYQGSGFKFCRKPMNLLTKPIEIKREHGI